MRKNDERRYKPMMCAYCKSWHDSGMRTIYGRVGYCPIVHETTYRTDWCKTTDEQELQRHMMTEYEIAMREREMSLANR